MASEDLTFISQHALLGLAILTAIPVVMFALWGQYYQQHITELLESKEKVDRAAELYRIRVAGAWMVILQLIIFFSAYPIRKIYPLSGLAISLAGLLLQGQIQFGLERKLRELEASHSEQLKLALRAFLWVCAGSALYVGLVIASILGAFMVTQALHTPQALTVAILILGTMVGIVAGLILNFGLAPVYLRKMLPIIPLEDAKTRALVEDCFARAGLTNPDFWIIQADGFKFGNAMIAGLPGGKGWFKPGLFISSPLLQALTPAELQAVVCHEVSHVSLRHLKRRFLMTLAVSVGLCGLSGLMAVLAYMALPQQFSGFVGPIGAVIAFFLAVGALRPQGPLHEMEADAHAVLKLGAEFEALASALRKLDALNDQQERGKSFGHPETEFRIQELKRKIEKENPDKDQAA